MNYEPIYEKHTSIKNILKKYHVLSVRSQEKFNTDSLCVIVDIQTALDNIRISSKQKVAISMFMDGYTYDEIGMAMNICKQTASEHIVRVCKKVSAYLVDNGCII